MNRRKALVPIVVLAVAAAALLAAFWMQVIHRLDGQDRTIAALQVQRDNATAQKAAASGALDQANDKLVQSGQAPVLPVPVPVPAPTPSTTPPAGPAGPGPGDAQVEAAVTAVLLRSPSLVGTQLAQQVALYVQAHPPAEGAPGRDATDQQVAAAVAKYLTANPPRAGPAGPAGAVGRAGRDGVDAQAPTREQLEAAATAALASAPPPAGLAGVGIAGLSRTDDCHLLVALTDGTTTDLGAFCGEPGAPGPTGSPGATGQQGTAGRGIASIATQGCDLIVTYTDGTTEDAGRVCDDHTGVTDPTGPATDPAPEPSDTPASDPTSSPTDGTTP